MDQANIDKAIAACRRAEQASRELAESLADNSRVPHEPTFADMVDDRLSETRSENRGTRSVVANASAITFFTQQLVMQSVEQPLNKAAVLRVLVQIATLARRTAEDNKLF